MCYENHVKISKTTCSGLRGKWKLTEKDKKRIYIFVSLTFFNIPRYQSLLDISDCLGWGVNHVKPLISLCLQIIIIIIYIYTFFLGGGREPALPWVLQCYRLYWNYLLLYGSVHPALTIIFTVIWQYTSSSYHNIYCYIAVHIQLLP